MINYYGGGNILPADSAISIDTYLHNIPLIILDKSGIQILSGILRLSVISLNVHIYSVSTVRTKSTHQFFNFTSGIMYLDVRLGGDIGFVSFPSCFFYRILILALIMSALDIWVYS